MESAPRIAEVTGPIRGHQPPWGDPGPGVAEFGYVVEEYQIAGTAVAYQEAPGTTLAPDGRWEAAVYGEATFRTRLLVVRPAEPDRFNGTVLASWQNVSAGVEAAAPRSGEVYRGYAWVGVSAQEVGIYGMPAGMSRMGRGVRRSQPLIDHDPERYGNLLHPGDQGSFDIFSQAARAVRHGRQGPVDPLGGLEVRRVVAVGGSQSAMRLVSYIDALQPSDGVVDGFVLSVWEGRAPALTDGPVSFGGLRTAIRADTSTPVIVVNSEFEVPGVAAVGMVDTDNIRIWEVAGAPHGPTRDRGEPLPKTGWGPNHLDVRPVYEAAIRHMHRWLSEGVPAPAQPRVEWDGNTGEIRRDQRGNALGGIRLPQMEAPIAEHRGVAWGTGRAPLFGGSRRFANEVARSLYGSPAEYCQRWDAAVDALVASGAVLEEDAHAMRAQGEATARALKGDLWP